MIERKIADIVAALLLPSLSPNDNRVLQCFIAALSLIYARVGNESAGVIAGDASVCNK